MFIAQDEALAAYVGSIYSFDDVIVGPVAVSGAGWLRFHGGPLHLDVTLGRRESWAGRCMRCRTEWQRTTRG